MYGDETESFVRFSAYAERYIAADLNNFVKIKLHKATGYFQAAFFALAGTRQSSKWLRTFFRVDRTYTSSWFRITLLIVVGINANNETLLLAQALVLIKNQAQWTWFFKQFCKAFKLLRSNICFILDREKGIPNALEEVLPKNCQTWCCQHIADNIQAKFSIKCVPLFWLCARAKTKVEFKNALQALIAHNVDASNYVNNIAHDYWAWYSFIITYLGIY